MKKLRILIPVFLIVIMISSCEKEERDSVIAETKAKVTENKAIGDEFTISYDAEFSEFQEAFDPYMDDLDNGDILLRGIGDPETEILTFEVMAGGSEPTPNPDRIVCENIGFLLQMWNCVMSVLNGPCGPPVTIGTSVEHGIYVADDC